MARDERIGTIMALNYKYAEVEDQKFIAVDDKGFPVVIDDEKEEEFGIDAIGTFGQIPKLRNEAKTYRLQKEEAEKAVKLLSEHEIDTENLPDWISNAKKALDTVANLKSGDLKKAEEVDAIKKAAKEELERQIKSLSDERMREVEQYQLEVGELDGLVSHLMIDQKLLASKFLTDKFAVSAEVVLPHVKKNFRVEKGEDGKRRTIGIYDDGEPILDPSNAYAHADIDVALQKLTDRSLLLKSLLKGSSASGTGAGSSAMTKSGRYVSKNPFKQETWNLTEQANLYKEDPEVYDRLKRDAGL